MKFKVGDKFSAHGDKPFVVYTIHSIDKKLLEINYDTAIVVVSWDYKNQGVTCYHKEPYKNVETYFEKGSWFLIN